MDSITSNSTLSAKAMISKISKDFEYDSNDFKTLENEYTSIKWKIMINLLWYGFSAGIILCSIIE